MGSGPCSVTRVSWPVFRPPLPHPRVFSVRVANKGVRVDAASRASRVEGSNLRGRLVAKSEKSEGAEIKVDGRKKRAKHRDTEFTEEGKRDGAALAAIPSFLPSFLRASRVNMRNDSTKVTDCQ